jgi:hypothetical protein
MLDKRPRMGLGSLLTTSLADAREKALQAHKLAAEGIDPIDAKHASRGAARAAAAKVMTFGQCAEDYVRDKRAGWRSPIHAEQWRQSLEDYIVPVIGPLPVSAVDTALILKVLRPIWGTMPETASTAERKSRLRLA